MHCFNANNLLLHFLLLLSKVAEGSTAVLLKFVLSSGVHVVSASFWCQVVGFFMLCGAVHAIEGKNKLPWMKTEVVVRIFLIGLLSCGAQLLLLQGLDYTNPTFIAIIGCLIPIFSSVIAVLFSVETLKYWTLNGQAKIMGIVLACSGAVVTSLYRGPHLINAKASGNSSLFYIGVVISFIGCVFTGALVNIQLPLLRKYKAPLSVVCGVQLVSMSTLGIINFIILKNWSIPPLAASMGILLTALAGVPAFSVQAWILTKTSIFLVCCYGSVQPIATIMLSAIFLRSTIFLGSIIGAAVVIFGVTLSGWADAKNKRLSELEGIEEVFI